jgi:hypothetical protein
MHNFDVHYHHSCRHKRVIIEQTQLYQEMNMRHSEDVACSSWRQFSWLL